MSVKKNVKLKTLVAKEKQFTREDWLRCGLESLSLYGLRGLNIEPLAKYMGVTKGSFYWHFKHRNDFLISLAKYWEEELTTVVIEKAKAKSKDPKECLYEFMRLVLKEESGKYDRDVRAWAAFDEIAEIVVKRVDQKRLSFISGLFRSMGFTKKESEMRSRILYLYIVGEFAVPLGDASDGLKYLKDKHKFFTS